MKRLLLICGLVLMLVASVVVTGCGAGEETPTATPTATPTPAPMVKDWPQGYYTFNMTAVDGRTRRYSVYVPWSYDGVTPVPVLMLIHGGFNGEMVIRGGTWVAKAEAEGILLVIPNGSRPDNNKPPSPADMSAGFPVESWGPDEVDEKGNPTSWDSKYWFGTAQGDDIGFLDGLIDQLDEDYAIDVNRVYAHGGSLGGMMVFRMIEDLNTRFAAFSSYIGVSRMPVGTVLERPVPIISMIGVIDPLRQGLESTSLLYGERGVGRDWRFLPWQEEIDILVTSLGMSPDDGVVIRDDGNVTATVYSGEGTELQNWLIHNMGHAFPTEEEYGVDGEELVWNFLKRFRLGLP